MNSSKHLPPNSGPRSGSQLNQSQRQNQEVEQRVNEILFHSMQLQRTLWLAVRQMGGSIKLDESATPPLWNLGYMRVKDAAGKDTSEIVINATLLPEATEEQLGKLATLLLGKKDDPSAAIDQVGLGEYPKSYTIKALQSRVIYFVPKGQKDNVWMARAEFDAQNPAPISAAPPQPPTTP